MSYWVYVHTCPNEKRYVGITTKIKPEFRWAEGNGYQTNKHFYSAIKKYGWNNIKHEAWELTCESEMYYAEKYLIAYYHTTESKFGYNHSSGGEKSASGCIRSEETRKKLSEIQKKIHSDPEYLKKLSESHKKRYADPGYREKMLEAQKKVHADPRYRKRISETIKKRNSDPEYRKRISETLKSKPHKPVSEEHRKHLAEANRRKAKDPEFRRKQSEAHKGKSQPKVKISLPDGTIVEMSKQNLTKYYINKGKKFEYIS